MELKTQFLYTLTLKKKKKKEKLNVHQFLLGKSKARFDLQCYKITLLACKQHLQIFTKHMTTTKSCIK